MITNEVTTQRLLLRQLENKDLLYVQRQFSDPDMCRYFSEPPCTIDEAQKIINHCKYKDDGTYNRFGMFNQSNGDFIGTCGFHLWDKTNKRVEIGYDVWKDYWGKGYAKEAIKPLLQFCFEKLDVECVCAYTHVQNLASAAVLKSFGFHLDGVLRGWIRVKDEQQSQNCFTLLKTEWRSSH